VIPPMKASGVIHPYYDWQQSVPGSSANSAVSPHPADLIELNTRFGTTPHRRKLLAGLIAYRSQIVQLGISAQSIQWVDGSFVEDKDPNDIDVLTIVHPPVPPPSTGLQLAFAGPAMKAQFHCDAYGIPLSATQHFVEQVTYWYGLFGHRRGTDEWKGLVALPLDPVAGRDTEALRLIMSMGVAP